MKHAIFFIAAGMVFASCGHGRTTNSISSREEQSAETWAAVQRNMAPGAEVSNERPFPDVLSEKEVLLKAVEYAQKIGALDTTYHLYQENPALLSAKIETPVLIYHVPTGTTNVYSLTAVDTDGTMLIDISVRSSVDGAIDSFQVVRTMGIMNVSEYSTHHITKREAIRLIKSQFPDKPVSEPIAIAGLRLENSRYSNYGVFWYFTVGDTNRSVTEAAEEYIIDSEISNWKNITGGMSNRAAISGGSPLLNWNRMAKLDTPLRIFNRIEAARSAGSTEKFTANPVTDIQYTPVPLK